MYIFFGWVTYVALMAVWGYVVGKIVWEKIQSIIEDRDKVVQFPFMGDRAYGFSKPESEYSEGWVIFLGFYPILCVLASMIWPVAWIAGSGSYAVWYYRAKYRSEHAANE